jgi:antitoxin component YwqK of YwqJK toxin-antitoxin module
MNTNGEKIKSFFFLMFFIIWSNLVFSQLEYKKFYHPNGNVSSEGFWSKDQPEGFWKTYNTSGVLIASGNRKGGLLDSTWKFFDSKGRIEKEIGYREGKKNGWEVQYDTLGVKVWSMQYLDNVKQGIREEYYANGQLHWRIPFDGNKEQGKAKEYSEDGILIGITKYTLGFVNSVERFNRYNKNGQREGLWKEFFPESEFVLKDGIWSNGKRNGLFQFYDKKGIVIRTELYENDILVTDNGGVGNLTFKVDTLPDGLLFRGGYSGSQKQGIFHVERPSGERITNQVFQQGIKVAEGLLDVDGMRQGIWKEFFLSGELKAQGEYKDNERIGPWVYFDKEGLTELKGNYWKGKPDGEWLWYYEKDKLHRREHFSRGKLDGEYVEWDTSGVVILEGVYSDDVKNGPWKFQMNDHLETGEYLDGEKNGIWKWYYYSTDQPAFEGEFNLGSPVGKHKMWCANGMVMEKGQYEGGLRSGDWTYFSEAGLLKMTVTYKDGEIYKIDGVRILPKGTADAEEGN